MDNVVVFSVEGWAYYSYYVLKDVSSVWFYSIPFIH